MPRYNVPLTGYANICVTVETDETDPTKIAELAEEQVDVSLCHQCAGRENNSLEIGDEWSAVKNNNEPEVIEMG